MSQTSKAHKRIGHTAFYSGARYADMNEAGRVLVARLGLRPLRSRVVQRSWLDSFDWRLYARGLVLERHEHDGASTCLLRKLDDGALLAQCADGSCTRPAMEPRDLRDPRCLDGILPSGVAQILGGRGLHVLAKCRERVREYVLEDDNGRVILQVWLSRAVSGAAHVRSELRLQLFGLAGHDTALERVRALLRRQTRFSAIDRDPVSAGHIGDREPGQRLTWALENLHGATRADQSCRLICAHYADLMESVQPYLWCGDIEFLHEFRIGVRRLRSILPHMQAVFPRSALDASRQLLVDLARLTSPARDADVQLADVRARLADCPEEPGEAAARSVLGWFIEHSERQQRQAYAALHTFLHSASFRRRWLQFRRTIAAPPDSAELEGSGPPQRLPGLAPRAALKASKLAMEAIAHLYDRASAQGHKIHASSKSKRLHDLRKTLKKLRYTLDAFLPLCAGRVKRSVRKSLKALQDVLGGFQDAEVQHMMLESLQEAIEAGDVSFDDRNAADCFIDAWCSRLQDQQDKARTSFARRFKRFVTDTRKTSFPTCLLV